MNQVSKEKPFLTLIVPTYKRPELLRECVQSILAQDFQDFEVIIINNDPEIPLVLSELVSEDYRFTLINRTEWVFYLKSINEQIKCARGQYFTYIPDDDYYAPGYFRAMYRALKENDFPTGAFSTYTSEPEDLCRLPGTKVSFECISGEKILREFLSRKLPLIGVYGFIKTTYLREIGGMVENRYCDLALIVQSCASDRLCLVREPLVLFRKHDQSGSWTSVDIKSYIESQIAWVQVSLPIFRSRNLSPHFNEFLWRILDWCVLDFYCVIARSPQLKLAVWPSYFRFIVGQSNLLGWDRWRVYKRIIFSLRLVLKSRWVKLTQTSMEP